MQAGRLTRRMQTEEHPYQAGEKKSDQHRSVGDLNWQLREASDRHGPAQPQYDAE